MAEVQYDVIVVGAGPAGSTLATLLAKKNRRVLILEKEKFPRYHIGESLVYGVIPILKELGVLEKVDAHDGFTKKYGGTYVWGNKPEPWDFYWGEYPGLDDDAYTYQVSRAEFDNLLLRHAESLGVDVREEHQVVDVLWKNERCVGVKIKDSNGAFFEAHAQYIVDATGQSALFGNMLKIVEYNSEFKNVAFWSYFKNAQQQEGRQAGNIYIECTSKGWLWFIPQKEITSVGLVATPENLQNFQAKDPQSRYFEGIESSREIRHLLENAERTDEVRSIRDWSFKCKNFYGPGFLMVGDAAGFVDPLFSTGVFLAMNGGSLGAKILDEALKHPEKEAELFARYESTYQKFFGAVVAFVRFFYDSSRELSSYYEQAKDLVDPFSNLADQEEFVFLISGLHGVYLSDHEKIVAEGLDGAHSLEKTEPLKQHLTEWSKTRESLV